ncbi:helicase-related protein [Nocardiopsis potens]|uniref:helicase-related protein n=1 Tax=Nocardiopsis potens TaxID=1246458 RepID=UPI0003488383|nr:helicase-related protein [Nocardiopsis potens]
MYADEIRPGVRLTGPALGTATIVAVTSIGEALQVTVRDDSGHLSDRMLFPDDITALSPEAPKSRWSFDADPAQFRLASEALRMRHAGLSDPMLAVETSNIDPLPHQIRAVYGTLLPQPGSLRFLLADDPGAGKTIMAGLYLKELLLRGDVQRCLIVAPGGLVEQWQTELAEKFGIEMTVLTRDLANAAPDGDPFRANPMLIARMDQLSRNDEWQSLLSETDWDLIVVDEAHRMSASWYGNKLRRTQRYELGQLLGRTTRHYLLMTATPHSGSEANYQAFLALLDPDRFEGQYRRGVHSVDTTGLMRRMVKEDLLTFDGKPLFPERVAETVEYTLSPAEMRLYDEVTEYVRTEMNRAEQADGKQRTVGFALTVLQRRLASSPEAIYQSIRRRASRLRALREQILSGTFIHEAETLSFDPDEFDSDELTAAERERAENEVLGAATAARTTVELDAELAALSALQRTAEDVRTSGVDRKWQELRSLIVKAHDDGLAGANGAPHKLIIFTEHRDTLAYLTDRVTTLLGGDEDAVVTIHGGTARQARREAATKFTTDPRCHVLIATDAAGEGLNLQAAHLMVNYDLPWNPNRIEQRFGRIHRIGQREVCRLWNLVASQTREGQVFRRLLTKIEEQRRAYDGKVFDVLGENAFTNEPLRDLLMQAIRYGERPDVRAHLEQVIDNSVAEGLEELLQERALATPEISLDELDELRHRMDEARARRMQPYFVQAFVMEALRDLGGRVAKREKERFELTHVPSVLREKHRSVSRRYSRITFEPSAVVLPGRPDAELIAPGHPLMQAIITEVLDRYGDALTQGAVLLQGTAVSPKLIVAILEELTDGRGVSISRRFQYVSVLPNDTAESAGPAPYLDLTLPIGLDSGQCKALSDAVSSALSSPWLVDGVEKTARSWAVRYGLPEHRAEVAAKLSPAIDRTRKLVQQRLMAQINYWDSEAIKLSEDQAAGKKIRTSPTTAQNHARSLEARLERRQADLNVQGQVHVRPPRIVGAALVLPATTVRGAAEENASPSSFALDTAVTERRAVDAVLAAERRLGRVPEEMPHSNKGFDIRSVKPDGHLMFIEVKGRVIGADDFTVTTSEVGYAKNAEPDYRLALVSVDPDTPDGSNDRVRYVLNPFADLVLDKYVDDLRRKWQAEWNRGVDPV